MAKLYLLRTPSALCTQFHHIDHTVDTDKNVYKCLQNKPTLVAVGTAAVDVDVDIGLEVLDVVVEDLVEVLDDLEEVVVEATLDEDGLPMLI